MAQNLASCIEYVRVPNIGFFICPLVYLFVSLLLLLCYDQDFVLLVELGCCVCLFMSCQLPSSLKGVLSAQSSIFLLLFFFCLDKRRMKTVSTRGMHACNLHALAFILYYCLIRFFSIMAQRK
jgi:hypothetical protein